MTKDPYFMPTKEKKPVTAVATLDAPVVEDIRPKFHLLNKVLNTEMIEREEIIESVLLALIARMHLFMLGRPGVAKSRLIDLLRTHIGGLQRRDWFKVLMTPYSIPEEMFGPIMLTMLKQDRIVYATEGYFPTAKLVSLEEIWNANSGILNALLLGLNEREFRNDGQMNPIPLHTMLCASNQLPQSDELNAIYDRIQFRHVVKPIQEQSEFIQMLKLRWMKPVGEVILWEDIEQAHRESQEVVIPDDVLEAINTMRQKLRNKSIFPTDRKFVDSIAIIQAKAWLSGEKIASIEHMLPLAHVWWTTQDEIPIVQTELMTLASPLDRKATDLLKVLDQLSVDTDKLKANDDIDQYEKVQEAVEIHTAAGRVRDDLKKILRELKKTGRTSVQVDKVIARLHSVAERIASEMFLLDEKHMEGLEMGVDDDQKNT